ncbi:MAG: M20/M25/M40 family metallo-hydrolase [Isosphaeraceae bacterium]
MSTPSDILERVRPFVNRSRMVETARELIAVPSRTGEAGAVSDRLAEILRAEGFAVERPTGGHDAAPAVVVRLDSGRPGKTLQFNGHLDTVHLPFVPPAVESGRITGSGAADMKGGTAAAIEALRAVRESGLLSGGSVLFSAHDLHESPWGDGRQLDVLIRAGYVGDAVLLPEPLTTHLPVIGRGLAVWKLALERAGAPVHEVMRPLDAPSVIEAAAGVIEELARLARTLSDEPRASLPEADPGPSSVFIGQVHAGEIYNQYPQVARLEGTRRWLPGTDPRGVESDLRARIDRVAREHGVAARLDWIFTRGAFALDLQHPIVGLFRALDRAARPDVPPLPLGAKPFVDDGNSFSAIANVPAITHGPRAGGAHTLDEWIEIDDMVRVAGLYAATALAFCPG